MVQLLYLQQKEIYHLRKIINAGISKGSKEKAMVKGGKGMGVRSK